MTSEVLKDNLDWFCDNGFEVDVEGGNLPKKIMLTIDNPTVRAIDIYNNLIRFYKISNMNLKFLLSFQIGYENYNKDGFEYLNFQKKVKYLNDNNIKNIEHNRYPEFKTMHSDIFEKLN